MAKAPTVTRLSAQFRTEFGKGAARRGRKAGLVPAVLYGHGSDTLHLSMDAREFARAVKGDSNRILTLDVEGKEQLALPRQIVRHPVKDYFQHVDLLLVRRGEKVLVEVPIHLVGEAAPGTLVLHELGTLSIDVDALAIPEYLEFDLAGAEAGTIITTSDIPLPAGATLEDNADTVVVAIQVPKEADEDEDDTEDVEPELVGEEAETADEE